MNIDLKVVPVVVGNADRNIAKDAFLCRTCSVSFCEKNLVDNFGEFSLTDRRKFTHLTGPRVVDTVVTVFQCR